MNWREGEGMERGIGSNRGMEWEQRAEVHEVSEGLIRIGNIMTMEESSHSNGIRRAHVTEKINSEDKDKGYRNGYYM